MVVVGDSQAHALAINLPDGIDDTFDVSDGSVEGCSVYDEGALKTERDGYTLSFGRCEGWQDEWAEAADRADADVALVVLGAWDVFDFELDDGTDLEFGSPEWDAYVTEGPAIGHRRAAPTGTRVALLEVPCMRPQDVEGDGVPALPERGDDDRVAHLNELGGSVADANPDTVTFVSGPTEWCDDEIGVQRRRLPLGRRPRVHARRQPHLHDDRSDTPLTLSRQPNARHSAPTEAMHELTAAVSVGIGTERLGVERCRVELQLADGRRLVRRCRRRSPRAGWRRPPG